MTKIITLIGADARFSASIAQLLKLKTKGQFALGDNGVLKLVDADSIEGRQAIERELDDHTVILTVSPELFKHPLIVPKPIKIEELLKVLEGMSVKSTPSAVQTDKKEAEQKTAATVGNPFAKFMDPNYLAKHKQQKREPQPTVVAEIVEPVPVETIEEVINPDQFLGAETTFEHWRDEIIEQYQAKAYVANNEYLSSIEKDQLIEMSSIYGNSDDIYYDMSDYVSFQLFKKIFLRELDHIHYFQFNGHIVFIFSDGMVLSNVPTEQLLVYSELKGADINLMPLTSKNEFMQLLKQFSNYCYLDGLVGFSRLILITSKGRIINGKDIKEPLGLMRKKEGYQDLIDVPYSKELDSVWGFRNVSLRDTVELLPEVNLFYIFSYYNLCDLYGFFDNELVDNKSKNQLDLNALLSELQKL